ncbi:hypothetical protein INT44_006036 [Umbelopsis vinacea]|uniref:FHA domain-containing protein n=1 Tax=Umbelopsis vinacea TaxID=44442 RepID=A0A8H7Q026_9FUNG|nr:hypothetical protein INT44_006036 [Umbelopsis vinacea]KAI9282039.1 SMAD/FHA domain-containing protein [Umbelopsis sp. AD052]
MPRSPSPSARRRNSRSPDRYRRSSDNYSRRDRQYNSRSRSRSPYARSPRSRSPQRRNASRSRSRSRERQRRPAQNKNRSSGGPKKYEWGKPEDNKVEEEPEVPVKKAEANFGLSGALAAETNTYKGVELKYVEPAEAREPTKKWRLYVFKGDKQIDVLHIHRKSAYLFGRDRVVADIPVDHPSCSKQHAVLQFRSVNEKNETNGQIRRVVKPFIIDLESTNGTHLNGDRIPDTRYLELKLSDVLKFGDSTREYVLLNEEASKTL